MPETKTGRPSVNVTTPRHSVGRERLRLFLRNPMGMFGFILVSLFFIAAIFAPMLATHDPLALDIPNRLSGPTLEHWAGTDQLGRDTCARFACIDVHSMPLQRQQLPMVVGPATLESPGR